VLMQKTITRDMVYINLIIKFLGYNWPGDTEAKHKDTKN
jgi:hypothetical protein